MHIIEIEIINNRKIRAFHSKLNGSNLEIAGSTGTGKTTAVSALWDIITKPKDGLTHGTKTGETKIVLSDGSKSITAKRAMTPKTSTISLFDSAGKDINISDFKKMISDLSLNPHKIMDLGPTDKTKKLLKVADMGDYNIEQVEGEIKQLESDRLSASQRADAIKPGDMPEKVDPVDIRDLQDQQKELTSKLAALNEQIAAVGETNSKAANYVSWQEQDKKYKAEKAKHEKLDKQIKAKRKELKDKLDSAKFPLEGLSIVDGEIVYNECLLDNLGTSEQMLVCAALSIKDILSRDIKVVRMDGIESMSRKDYELLKGLYNGHDIQVLSTRVSQQDEHYNGEIVIEEGVYDDGSDTEEVEADTQEAGKPTSEVRGEQEHTWEDDSTSSGNEIDPGASDEQKQDEGSGKESKVDDVDPDGFWD